MRYVSKNQFIYEGQNNGYIYNVMNRDLMIIDFNKKSLSFDTITIKSSCFEEFLQFLYSIKDSEKLYLRRINYNLYRFENNILSVIYNINISTFNWIHLKLREMQFLIFAIKDSIIISKIL